MSGAPAFLWWGASGSNGIAGSLEAACSRAAAGAIGGRLRATVREARTALDAELEETWVPTGRVWAGRPSVGGVVWEELAAWSRAVCPDRPRNSARMY